MSQILRRGGERTLPTPLPVSVPALSASLDAEFGHSVARPQKCIWADATDLWRQFLASVSWTSDGFRNYGPCHYCTIVSCCLHRTDVNNVQMCIIAATTQCFCTEDER